MAKRVIATALGWHTRWLVDQIYTFGANTVAATTVLLDRVHDHDAALSELRHQLARPRQPQDQTRAEDVAARQAAYADLFGRSSGVGNNQIESGPQLWRQLRSHVQPQPGSAGPVWAHNVLAV